MLHRLLDRDPWFRAKRFGYGAGLPIAWQGWALLIAHMALLIGLIPMFAGRPLTMALIAIVLAALPMPIYARHTEGGWRWRNGRG